MTGKGHALARDELVRALIAYTGVTTADGATPGNDTLVCAHLIGVNDFITNKTILISSGAAVLEDSGASSFDPLTGEITVASPFSAQIKAGTIFRVLNISTVEIDVDVINTKIGTNVDAAGTTTLFARLRQIVDDYLADGTIGLAALKTLIEAGDIDVAAIEAKLDDGATGLAALKALLDDILLVTGVDLEAKLDKLAGEAPVVGTATEDWNTAEADIVSIGANDTKNKLHSLILDISGLTATATISIRMYMQVNGVEKKVYDQDFVVGTDPDGLWIVNGTVGIHEILRVTAQSDNAADDGKTIAYDYMLETM